MKVTLEKLYAAMQQGFAEVDKKFNRLEKEMNQRFTAQFSYFDNKFKEVNDRIDNCATKEDFHGIQAILDKYESRFEAAEIEVTALVSQTRRHETWIQKLARSMAHYLKMS